MAFSVKLSILLYQRPQIRHQCYSVRSSLCVLTLIFALYLKTYFCSHTVDCASMTQCLKSPRFVDLLISCVVSEHCGDGMACWGILFQRLIVVMGSGRKWVQRFFFSPPLFTLPLSSSVHQASPWNT